MAENDNPTNSTPTTGTTPGSDDAADLIRDRIDELHGTHKDDAQQRSHEQMTLLERFWHHHGSHPDQEAAWNTFYANLSDSEKHQLWQESQTPVEHKAKTDQPVAAEEHKPVEHRRQPAEIETGEVEEELKSLPKTPSDVKKHLAKKSKQAGNFAKKHKTRIAPLMTAALVIIFILIVNYNNLVIAQVKQYITPGTGQNSPTIIDPNSDVAIGKEPRLIIPKINVDVPVVYDVTTYDEAAIQAGLEEGVVHYGTTPVPGEAGNNVIVGHSSNNFFNGGKYKFAFVLLDRLEKGDTFILHYEGKRYIYRVYNKVIVEPTDFSIIQPTPTPTTTLITCTPPGTSWHRLAIQAEQISPAPTKAQTAAKPGAVETEEATLVPGNSPSLFDRLWP